MTDETDKTWPLKDVLLFVPLAASKLAISWEVGRFVPFNGFRFFTLSEHLLAAMGALPVASAEKSHAAREAWAKRDRFRRS